MQEVILIRGRETSTNGFKKIFFFHIPKCAGLSINYALSFLGLRRIPGSSHNLSETITKNENFINDVMAKKEKINKDILIKPETYIAVISFQQNKSFFLDSQFISGHLPFENLNNYSEFYKLTLLRDPIERSISNFNFWIDKGFIDKNLSIEFLYKNNILQSNLMTNFFSKKEDVKEAIKNLKKIDLISDTKQINNVIEYLISIFNLPNILLLKINTSKSKKILDKDNIEIIKKYNHKDIEFFEEAKKYFFDFNNFKREKIRKFNYYSIASNKALFGNEKELIFEEKDLGAVIDNLSLNGYKVIE